ncbi:phospholipase D-like domain-containing protein [Mycolicibacterium novocastrense]|nr:phospholipase D-like domain-containing protein [Mycolicibacterium novocastrense]
MQIFDIENHRGLPVYVHAKLCIVDDVWALVGSANLNMRSWTYDAEIAAAVLDSRRDPRAPEDPAGLGDGARHFARELRLQLMREHVETQDDTTLLDLDQAAETMRRSAANLDGWYRSGRRGTRPTGRLRTHVPVSAGKNPGWRRWLVEPAYRAVYDPDGRPTFMRLRRSY